MDSGEASRYKHAAAKSLSPICPYGKMFQTRSENPTPNVFISPKDPFENQLQKRQKADSAERTAQHSTEILLQHEYMPSTIRLFYRIDVPSYGKMSIEMRIS